MNDVKERNAELEKQLPLRMISRKDAKEIFDTAVYKHSYYTSDDTAREDFIEWLLSKSCVRSYWQRMLSLENENADMRARLKEAGKVTWHEPPKPLPDAETLAAELKKVAEKFLTGTCSSLAAAIRMEEESGLLETIAAHIAQRYKR